MRDKLSGLLRERYMGGRPDFVTVVLHADGFPQLLETLTFVKRVERADARVLNLVRDARGEAGAEQCELQRLAAWQARERTAVLARRNALASITAGLRERRDTIARAHAARVAALDRTRSGRRQAERELSRLLAARARAARDGSGPRAGRGRSRGRSCSASRGGRTRPPTAPVRRGTTRSSRRPAGFGGSTSRRSGLQAGQDRLARSSRPAARGAGRGCARCITWPARL